LQLGHSLHAASGGFAACTPLIIAKPKSSQAKQQAQQDAEKFGSSNACGEVPKQV
jgi:hypothetical protein